MSNLVPGLFGKLPAHGDFVRRGWPDETVGALDAWLTEALSAAQAGRDEAAFVALLSGAPMWQGYLPPGAMGPWALHLALAPSIDKAGRYFFLTGGVAGPADAVWAQAVTKASFSAALGAAMYDALASTLDADAMLAALAAATRKPEPRTRMLAGAGLPSTSAWWIDDPADGDPLLLRSFTADAPLLGRLLAGEVA